MYLFSILISPTTLDKVKNSILHLIYFNFMTEHREVIYQIIALFCGCVSYSKGKCKWVINFETHKERYKGESMAENDQTNHNLFNILEHSHVSWCSSFFFHPVRTKTGNILELCTIFVWFALLSPLYISLKTRPAI